MYLNTVTNIRKNNKLWYYQKTLLYGPPVQILVYLAHSWTTGPILGLLGHLAPIPGHFVLERERVIKSGPGDQTYANGDPFAVNFSS